MAMPILNGAIDTIIVANVEDSVVFLRFKFFNSVNSLRVYLQARNVQVTFAEKPLTKISIKNSHRTFIKV